MADRLEESVEIIRRDRDRSRDFLADVSHELRTPIAAMHTFIELLQGPAGRDPAARTEFLDSSAAQLDRLDWLAQNLLELSKLDSGPGAARPAPGRRPRHDRVRRGAAARHGRAQGDHARPPRSPTARCGIQPRRAAHRPGRGATSSATRSSSRGAAARSGSPPAPRPTAGRGSRWSTRASASTRPSCRTSSSASTAAPRRTRRAAPAPAWASRSSSPSWTCTTGRSRWRAASGRGSRFVVTLPRDPTRTRRPAQRGRQRNLSGRWMILHRVLPRA